MATKTSGFAKKDTTEKKTSIGGNHGMIKTGNIGEKNGRLY